MFTFPENCKNVVLQPPTTTNAAITSDYISTKNAIKVWIECVFKQAATHQTVLTIKEATHVAGTSADSIAVTMPNWTNSDISTSDTLTKNSDSATVTLAAGKTDQHVIVEVDPSILSADHDCICAYTSASSEATNFVSIVAHILERYPQGTPPTAITD
jgi:hypothetical protein